MQIRNYRRNIKKLRRWIRDENIDIWSLDEVHFQQYGSRCRMWVAPEESDPILLHHPGRRSVGYFGAVRIRDGKFTYKKETDKFDGESFQSFMKHLRRVSSKSGRRVIAIIDNARYHHAKLHEPWRNEIANIMRFDFLPPYSPDLNPIERLWKLTRRLCIHNRYFPDLTDVISAVEKQFNQWSIGNETIKRLCAIT